MDFTSVAGNTYMINVGMKLNKTTAGLELKKALSEMEKISTVDVKVNYKFEDKNGKTQIKEAIKRVNTYRDAWGNLIETVNLYDKNMKALRDGKGQFLGTEVTQVKQTSDAYRSLTKEINTCTQADGKRLTTVTEMLSNGKKVTTETLSYRNALGQLVTETQKFDDQLNPIGKKLTTIADDTSIVTTETEKYIDAQGREVEYIKKLDAQRNGTIQTITKEINANGQLVKTVEEVQVANNQIVASTNRLVSSETELNNVHKTSITETNKYVDAQGREITTTKKLDAQRNGTIEIITREKNARGQLITTTEQMKVVNDNAIASTRRLISSETDLSRSTSNITIETNKYIDAQGREVSTIMQLDAQRNGSIQIITQEVNAQGLLTKTTEKMVVSNGVAIASTRELISTETELSNVNKTLTTTIDKVTTSKGKEITTTKQLDAQGNGTVEIITKEKNAKGQLITTTERMNVVRGVESQQSKVTTQQIETQSKSLMQLLGVQNDVIATMGKIIKFQIITKIITGFTTACRNAVTVVKEFDSALTEFKKVSDLSGDALDDYTKKLGELGTAVARTRTQMVEASTQFKKSGFTDEDSAQLAQVSS